MDRTLDADGTLTISGTGAMKNYDYDSNQSPVYNNSDVKKIVIEDGVTSIGDYAFRGCSSLTSITLPDSVTSIGDCAFVFCVGLSSITLPDSVTSIGDSAFKNCSSLTSITIPDSVTSIGDWTFYKCSSLTSITIPNSVTSIGDSAFYNCRSLTSITIPDRVTSIESSAFYNCSSLTSITIPKSVTSIGSGVFNNCNNLTVYLENGSTLTSNVLGVDESKIVSYSQWNEDNLTWKLYEDGTLNISGTGAMKNYIYGNNKSPARLNLSVTSIVIEEGVTSIGDYAFENCDNLTSITIPGNVESIGESAFYNCDNLTDVTLQDGVKSIGDAAFIWCNNLTNIVLPNSITSIEGFAFKDCTSLTSITIPDGVTSIGEAVFYNCTSLTSITIPDSVTSIGNRAFLNCNSLTSITIPDSVTSIGNRAFDGCSSLKTISLSCKSSLKKSNFGEQANLVSYTNQHLLTKTAAKAATCSESGNKAYWTCEHCGKYFLSDDTNPETATAVEQSETIIPALKHKNATTRDAVEPNGTKPGYSGDRYCPDCDTVLEKGYTYWNEGNLTWKLDADGTLNISGTGAMKDYDSDSNPSPIYNNSDVKEVVIEDGVTSIGNKAFDSCSSLTSITIPNSVTSIKAATFYGCTSLTSITIPDGVTSIGYATFTGCSSLTSITIPDSVTSIGYATFTGCSSLTSITIPDSVTSIGYATFTGCSSLTSITIPDSVTSIGYATFAGCSSLTSITIPDSVTSIGESAFSNCSSLQTISLSCKSTLKRSDFGDQADLVSYALHTLKKTEAKAATYTENGNIEHWTCEHCGKYFLSDDSNPETAKAVELSETVIPALVQVATTTTPIKCVYGQDMNKIDLRDYVKNTDVVGEVTVKVATGSTLPDGMKLDGSKLSGKPAKAYEDGKEVTFTFTAENGNTANLTLLFLVAKADPTVEVAVSGDSHTEGDLVSELKLILSENSTKGVVEVVSEIKALVAGKNTLTWKFTPEDENNYHTVTGTVVVNAQTTTTTTTKATTTTTKATTTTKPNKTTTTKVTTTTKPNKTTTTKATTTTKPNKTTTTKVTTTNTAIPSYGDINLDGKVDIVDAIFLNKYLATLIQFSDAQVANADCCQDGVLNDQDTTALMQFIILLIDDLPVQPTEK